MVVPTLFVMHAALEGTLRDLYYYTVAYNRDVHMRPTAKHLPVARWVEPATFDRLKAAGEAMGIPHVEASPLTRSSYHARQSAEAAGAAGSAG